MDLPAPERPMTPSTEPCGTERSMPSSAVDGLRRAGREIFETLSSRTIGSAGTSRWCACVGEVSKGGVHEVAFLSSVGMQICTRVVLYVNRFVL